MQGAHLENGIKLPEPRYDGRISVEHALANRRSVRRFSTNSLTLSEFSQLLWSAQGISSPKGYRTAPSAGALYPLELYALAGKVQDLPAGIYKYITGAHALLPIVAGDRRNNICRAALQQDSVAAAPAVFLFCAVNERVTRTYGDRGIRYIFMEIGHAAQNVCLQAIALGLETVVIGAFRDNDVKRIAHLGEDERPAYIVPIGRK